ncbi:MAG: DUF2723 domain-containing protein [Candidatus Eisenbacteria bacterium]|uniref:DUF2723 domain-containing protein n=1 Tax=Eiseniibacteriota bacterium TaxID=2212470 RepID=A0A937X9I1_UNCEI|nr:DUF2723 domain-containing protein [Candidatus Eisenbacteria bacterium]
MRLAGFLAAALAPLGVYLVTLARHVTFIDSGELAAVAARLGIAHPPGYPLFTILGHLLSLIPVGPVCLRVGLLSALASALACGLIFLTGLTLLQRPMGAPEAASGLRSALPALAGAWLFGFARTPWSQAVVVEVYALQALFTAGLWLALASAWRRGPGALSLLPWAAFACGLALANHLTGAFLLPALLFFTVAAWRDRRHGAGAGPTRIGRAILAGILPLLLYAYLPLRARGRPEVFWDLPLTWERFWVHVTARQYQGALGSQGLRWGEAERFFAGQLPEEATWLFVALAATGLVALLARARRIGVALLMTFVLHVLYNMAYPFHDISLFYIPALAVCGIWAAAGAGWLVEALGRRLPRAALALGALLCLGALLPLGAHWRENDQSGFRLLRHFIHDALRTVEPGAVVFSGLWDMFSAPALYSQEVEGLRPDVLVLDIGQIAAPSLAARLAARAPDLLAACRPQVDSLAAFARMAERGEAYDRTRGRRAHARLQQALLDRAVGTRPTYVTSEMHRHPAVKRYRFVAEGLLVRVPPDDAYRPVARPLFEGPGITRAQARDERERFVQFEYGRMLMERARYEERHGFVEEAEALARMAEELWR